jgi:hypothetical protein
MEIVIFLLVLLLPRLRKPIRQLQQIKPISSRGEKEVSKRRVNIFFKLRQGEFIAFEMETTKKLSSTCKKY